LPAFGSGGGIKIGFLEVRLHLRVTSAVAQPPELVMTSWRTIRA
jgi:hypothetical protein